MPSGAEIIARRLYEAGCRHAFGIPGGEVLALIAALDRAGIRFVLCKHENAGGFMAEGTHHATGAPALLVATLGPGVANLVNVVANALQDRVPMIVLSGCVDAVDAVTYTHQLFDHRALLAPVTKASLTVVDGAVDALIDKALAIALDGQPGPVHLDLPIAVATARQPERPPPRRAPVAPAAPAPGAALDRARALLADAERPLVIAGVDALNQAGAAAAVEAFVRDLGIPLVTTYKAKGILDEAHPLALGAAGLSPKADVIVQPLVRQADLVVLAGYDPIEMRAGWRDPWAPGTPVLEFAAVPNTHYVHQAELSFVGDLGAGLRSLRAGVNTRPAWPGGEAAATRRALAAAFPGDEAWGPAAVIDAVRQALPGDCVATVDTGAHRILLSQMWRCARPRTLLQSSGLCTMGCALPLAIGHSLAGGGAPVVAFTGDAGLEMVLGELATLRDLRLPVIVVVFVDCQLALIELKQRGAGLGSLGVEFGATDFGAVAAALGGHGATVGDRAGLAAELAAGLAREGFTLIACPIGQRPYDGRI